MKPIGDVVVNGERRSPEDASVRMDDAGLLRGYGCFEAMRTYSGVAFRLGEHLDRLQASATAMGLPLPPREELEAWCGDRAAVGDVVVRVVVTSGSDIENLGTDASTIVFAHEAPPRQDAMRLYEVVAPWHPAGQPTELAAVKTLSYAPNTAALLRAKAKGFDDAVLLDIETTVLELPMASIGWVIDGVIETPALDLGILRSVTRNAMIEVAAGLGLEVAEGAFPSARLHAADEAFVMSTTKEITPVVAIGTRTYDPGPFTQALFTGFRDLVDTEVAAATADG